MNAACGPVRLLAEPGIDASCEPARLPPLAELDAASENWCEPQVELNVAAAQQPASLREYPGRCFCHRGTGQGRADRRSHKPVEWKHVNCATVRVRSHTVARSGTAKWALAGPWRFCQWQPQDNETAALFGRRVM